MDCHKLIRLGFLRKVYGILTVQLMATAFVCYLAMKLTGQYVGSYETLSLGSFIVSSRAFYWFIFVTSFALLIALLCFKNIYPVNYLLLSGWTLAISCSVASACVVALCDPMVVTQQQQLLPLSLAVKGGAGNIALFENSVYCAVGTEVEQHGTNAVLMAVGITTTLFLGLTAFTFQSKWDFSFLGAGLASLLWILIFWGICMALFGSTSEARYWYRYTTRSVHFLLTGLRFGASQLGRGSYLLALHHLRYMEGYCIAISTCRPSNDSDRITQISAIYGPDDYILGAIDLYLVRCCSFFRIIWLICKHGFTEARISAGHHQPLHLHPAPAVGAALSGATWQGPARVVEHQAPFGWCEARERQDRVDSARSADWPYGFGAAGWIVLHAQRRDSGAAERRYAPKTGADRH